MKKPNDADRLKHVLDAIAKVERYLDGLDSQAFQTDELRVDAVVRNIEIIGGAITCLDSGLKAKHPQVEWRFATAIRNRLIHGYFDVDAEIVWNTAHDDLPILKNEIQRILETLA